MADRNPDLETQIARSPDDVALYQVYADWLSQRGDPRGELIAMSIAAEQRPDDAVTKRVADLHAAHDAEWLGALAKPPDGVTLTWRRGFVDSITVGGKESDEIDMVEAYVVVREATRDAPVASMIRKLTLGAFSDDDGEPSWGPVTLAMVEHGVPSTLRELHYDRGSYWDISGTYVDHLDKLYPQLAGLETLFIEMGHMGLGAIDLPALRDFEVHTGGFTAENMRSVIGAKWPRLERLALTFGNASEYGGTTVVDDVLPLLVSTSTPRLKHLGLANCGYTDQLIAPLAESPLVRQLESLDLSRGLLGDDGAHALAERAGAFRHLVRLDVGKSYVSPDAVARLNSVFGDRLVAAGQQRAEEYNGRVYRYCQIGE